MLTLQYISIRFYSRLSSKSSSSTGKRNLMADKSWQAHVSVSIVPFWPYTWVSRIEVALDNNQQYLQQVLSLSNIDSLTMEMQRSILPVLRISGGKLMKVKSLCLTNGSQTSLPPILRFCHELEELHLGYNNFRYLPFWITNLRRLEKLTRFGNPLIFQVAPFASIEICLESNSNGDINDECEDGQKQLTAPSSLFLLAATAVLVKTEVTRLLLNHDNTPLEIPTNLVSDLIFLASKLNFCDYCNQAFCCEKYAVLRKTFRDFKGYKNIPFEAVCCTELCSNALFEKWMVISRKEEMYESATLSVEISDSPSEDSQPSDDVRPGLTFRKRMNNVLKCALCCC